MMKKLFSSILSIIFPIECLACNKENTWLCWRCLKSIKAYATTDNFKEPINYLNGVISACPYDQFPLKQAIHAFKFNFTESLSAPLACLMVLFFIKQKSAKQFQGHLVLPIPLSRRRKLERGFNQAELLAQKFSSCLNLAYSGKLLAKRKNTAHQVGLNRGQRRENIKNCFEVLNHKAVANQKIILIDDVVTTGSTLDEAAKCLKESGAAEVWGFTVALD